VSIKPEDVLRLLQRSDFYEITGNQMTSYSSTLGGGSINFWDGRKASFDPGAPLDDMTAFVQVLDPALRVNLLQQVYHFWRPDAVETRYRSHSGCYVEERKTVWDDTFVSMIEFHAESPLSLAVRLEGVARKGARARVQNGAIVVEEVAAVPDACRDWPGIEESRIFKIIGFDAPARPSLEDRKYALEFAVELDERLAGPHVERRRVALVVAAAETEAEAWRRYRAALAEPDSLFEKRRAFWLEYFGSRVPGFECDDPALVKLYYFTMYVVASNVYDIGAGFFKRPFESTGKFRLLAQWFWDSAFGAMVSKWTHGLPIPESSLRTTLEAQDEEGRLPFSLCRDSFNYGPWRIIQPFILPMAVWDVYLKTGDKALLADSLPGLDRFDAWMMENRDSNGEQLVNLQVPGESGWDNCKRYIQGPHLVQSESPMMRDKRFIQSPDFNTYVYLGRKLMARMARELGRPEAAEAFEARAEATAAGVMGMWSEAAGLFMDRFEAGHGEIPTRTPGGVIPLISGLCDERQVDRMTANLTDPRLFWTEYPVTTLDLADPDYNDTDEYFSYWNGRVWPPVNWLIAEGLCLAGRYDVASELVARSLRMCMATGEPWLTESYHPRTGYPYLTHNTFNYIWGGLFADMLLRRVAGLQPYAARDTLIVNPLPGGPGRIALTDVRFGAHAVDVVLVREGEGVALSLSHRGERPLVLVTSAGQRVVANETVAMRIRTFSAPHWLAM